MHDVEAPSPADAPPGSGAHRQVLPVTPPGVGPAGRASANGRFAPSPTGPLHLGSLRTALTAWLFARSQGARFLVRIEDLDPQRSRREHEAGQLADLQALGLDWDEPPVRQSERTALYAAALSELQAAGRLYPCFCTRAEIRQAASAPHGERLRSGLPPGAYPGTCRRLNAAERRERIAAGVPYALRLEADAEEIAFYDRLLGRRTMPVDDFVVWRSDGVPAYQLAVVVDDAAQGVGEVVRGADLASSTPRQILLARLLGLPEPRYAHIGLVLGPDRQRLAKRHGSITLELVQADGRTMPEVLAWLAHSLGLARNRGSVGSAAGLLAEFDPDRVPRGPMMLR